MDRVKVGLIGYGLAGSTFQAPIITSVNGLQLSKVVSSQPEKVHRDHPDVAVAGNVKAGKHVVIDKPMANRVEEADDLIRLARQNNCTAVRWCIRRLRKNPVAR